eukprot:4083125-Alexandrium_andersonii.AAC.1
MSLHPFTARAHETRALFGTHVPSVAQRGWERRARVTCVPAVCACTTARSGRHSVSGRGTAPGVLVSPSDCHCRCAVAGRSCRKESSACGRRLAARGSAH